MLAGLGIAGTAIALRVLAGSMKQMERQASKLSKSSAIFTSYYRGGFEPKMSRREAGLILGESFTVHCHSCGPTVFNISSI